MSTTIAFPLTADLQECAVQGALAELTEDLALMLGDCPLGQQELARLALALCGAIPGSAVSGVVLHCGQYFVGGEPADPIVMIVQVYSASGCSELEWPICPPGPQWLGEQAQHAAAAGFMTSVCA